jgi:hypothetical protein
MSGGSGGGSPIIAAYAVVRNLIRTGRAARYDDERARLDAEELREVEYESMGLAVSEHPSARTARSTFPGRLLRRLHRR